MKLEKEDKVKEDDLSLKKGDFLKNYYEIVSECPMRLRPLCFSLGKHHREYIEQEKKVILNRDLKHKNIMKDTMRSLNRHTRSKLISPKIKKVRSLPYLKISDFEKNKEIDLTNCTD